MFRIMLTLSVTLLHGYVLWRAASTPFFKNRFSAGQLAGGGFVLWAVLAAGGIWAHGHGGPLFFVLEWTGMAWMGVLLLLATPLAAVDLATGFGLLFRHAAPLLRQWALITGGLLCLAALVQGLRPPVITHHDVRIAGLPTDMDNTLVAVLTDLHIGPLLGEKWLSKRIARVAALKPDLVVLVGDIVEGHGISGPHDRLAAALGRFSAPLGVWAVYGNHEFYDRSAIAMTVIQKAGINVLRNRWAEIAPGLVLAGVDDLTIHKHSGKNDDPVRHALENRPPGAATVLLSHTPWDVEKAARLDVDLMLSGHTHGGQIWPFDLPVKLTYPFIEGRYSVGAMALIVSRGTGTWGPRMRLWAPGEILAVRLRATARPDTENLY
ncbi:MAG: metallophosphoesterase [Thermodesulfobacteriota bacterium]|nr:metallophosphoesterase [Thermodesulfobacteriota bacterium]